MGKIFIIDITDDFGSDKSMFVEKGDAVSLLKMKIKDLQDLEYFQSQLKRLQNEGQPSLIIVLKNESNEMEEAILEKLELFMKGYSEPPLFKLVNV